MWFVYLFLREISRNENRFYKDSDEKWPHDLYFRDEQISKSRHSMPRRDHDRFEFVKFLKINLSIMTINLLDVVIIIIKSNFI